MDSASIRCNRRTMHVQAPCITGSPWRDGGITLAQRCRSTNPGSRLNCGHVVVPHADEEASISLTPTRLMRRTTVSNPQNMSTRSGVLHDVRASRASVVHIPGSGHSEHTQSTVRNFTKSFSHSQLTSSDTHSFDVVPEFRSQRGYLEIKHLGRLVKLLDLSLPVPWFQSRLSKRRQPQYIEIVRPVTSGDDFRGTRRFKGPATQTRVLTGTSVTASNISCCGASKYNHRQQTIVSPRRIVFPNTPHCSPIDSQDDLRSVFSPITSNSGSADVQQSETRCDDVTSDSHADRSASRVGGDDRVDRVDCTCTCKYRLTVYLPCVTTEGTNHA